MVHSDPENMRVFLQCDEDRSKILCFETDGESHYINLYTSAFWTCQDGIRSIIRERVRMAWRALTGKRYYLFDIQVSKENMDKLVHYLREYVDRSS
jgi:hypothetical protein